MESVMNTREGECYVCGRHTKTESHHCIHGFANRKIAEREGLKVWLCHDCHRRLHDSDHELDLAIQEDAQRVWEMRYMAVYPYMHHAKQAAREAWLTLFGKSYIRKEVDDD